MSSGSLLRERIDGVAVLTLNRPEVLNALDSDLWAALGAALQDVGADDSVRAVVLAGAGRGFCSGADIRRGLPTGTPESVPVISRWMESTRSVVDLLASIPQPVVAAVHGAAVGAGVALAAACDLRVVGPEASFTAMFTRIGLSGGDVGLTWYLPRLVGPHLAADLILTGRRMEADEAVRSGFGSSAVDARVGAIDTARMIADNSAFGVRASKELLRASLAAGGQSQHLEHESRVQVLCSQAPDHVRIRNQRLGSPADATTGDAR